MNVLDTGRGRHFTEIHRSQDTSVPAFNIQVGGIIGRIPVSVPEQAPYLLQSNHEAGQRGARTLCINGFQRMRGIGYCRAGYYPWPPSFPRKYQCKIRES